MTRAITDAEMVALLASGMGRVPSAREVATALKFYDDAHAAADGARIAGIESAADGVAICQAFGLARRGQVSLKIVGGVPSFAKRRPT